MREAVRLGRNFAAVTGAQFIVQVLTFLLSVTLVLGGSTMLQAFAGTFQSFFRAYERLEYTALVVLAERGITIGVTFALLALGYGLFEIAVTFLAGGGLSLALSIALVRRKFTW